MPNDSVERFERALLDCENSQDPSSLIGLFADACEISNVAIVPLKGKEGVTRFWRDYLAQFQEVRTEFTTQTLAENRAFLEWVSVGRLRNGRPVRYEGLTLLELGPDGEILRMKAYHDSAVFLREGGKHAERIGKAA